MRQNTKDWIQYSGAIAMIVSAIVIAFVAFLVSGTIVQGVLIYIAEALVFAGGVFGLSIYFKSALGEFESKTIDIIKDKTKNYIDDKLKNLNFNEDSKENNSKK